MLPFPRRRALLPALCSAVLSVAHPVGAQAFNYPSMQTPSASTRDYTAALVGGSGTTLLFQWREGAGRGMHWQLDAGLADPKGSTDPLLFVGGSLARELVRASGDQPLDLLFTAGIGAAAGDGTWFRVPVGVSAGHRFGLDDGMSITPYVHPRLSVDVCGRCGAGRDSRSSVSLNFDIGALWQVNRQFGVRASAAFTGSDVVGSDETVGVGVTWTPTSLRRP
jgi:hypothetical protein